MNVERLDGASARKGVAVKEHPAWREEKFCLDHIEIERQVEIWVGRSLKMLGNTWCSQGREGRAAEPEQAFFRKETAHELSLKD